MKKRILIGALIVGIFTVGTVTISSSASDRFTQPFADLKTSLEKNKPLKDEVIVKVGRASITRKNLEDLRSQKKIQMEISGQKVSLDDKDLLEKLITDELLLQKAEELHVAASLEDGKKRAMEAREILKQSPEAQVVQQKIIESLGLTEDQYWNDHAPAQYQKLQSISNAIDKLVELGQIPDSQDPNIYGQNVQKFKKELYENALTSKVVRVESKDISL